MAKNGLDKWFAQKWVDIGSKKKDGSFSKCGRSKQKADAKRKYPKCVPLAKARSMSEGQRRSAVKRKMVLSQSVEDQNRRKMQNVNIQNVSHLQKQDVCLKDKDDQQFLEKEQLHKVLVVNQLMLQHLLKEKKWDSEEWFESRL